MKNLINEIFEDQQTIDWLDEKLSKRIHSYRKKISMPRKARWDEDDVFLITYADQFTEADEGAFATFEKVYTDFFAEIFPIVHFLPFYPYTSDDGFSVVDYEKINAINGDWADVQVLQKKMRLMFDFVCNHMSAKSDWFEGYLAGDESYRDFFIDMDPATDLSQVTRPRTSPLLTPFEAADGSTKHVWTTFSADQVDLNFANPKVLLRMIDVLLFYLDQGAAYIRLDAIGFLWKELGTTSMHHEKTHAVVKLMRAVCEAAAPGTVLITETNVPHLDNISYFGNGEDEAQMVYQFPLPPLTLYSVLNQNTKVLKEWIGNIELPSQETTFFNFLASHDGIGLNPIRGIVPEEEILAMVESLKAEGAFVNYKANPDGSSSPYEVNATYIDALSKRADSNDLRLKRFLLAHSVLLGLKGVPAVYVQSILGGQNNYAGVEATGENRTINRKKYQFAEVAESLADDTSLIQAVYQNLSEMIKVRRQEADFHPDSSMTVVDSSDELLIIQRNNDTQMIHNFTEEAQTVAITAGTYVDLLTNETVTASEVRVNPYGFMWLKKQ